MSSLDRRAVWRGAGFALGIVVPGALIDAVARSHRTGVVEAVAFLLILVGFAVGGFAAAKASATLPLKHAAAAAALAFVVVQGALVVELAVRGKPIAVGGVIASLLLAACAGVIGGMVAARARPS